MENSNDDDRSQEVDGGDLISDVALSDFLEGVEEKIGLRFQATTLEEKRQVKREIARKLGVEEHYHGNVFLGINSDGDEGVEAYVAVEERYERLRKEGKIREQLDSSSNGDNLFDRINKYCREQSTGS